MGSGNRGGAIGFVPVTGGRLWYRVVGSGDATPLLVIHGGPGFPSHYLDRLAVLADERPVVFYDQLGCGRSDRPEDTSLWTLDRFVRELQQVRDALGLHEVHPRAVRGGVLRGDVGSQ